MQLIHFVGLRWSVEFLVEVGGEKLSFQLEVVKERFQKVFEILGCKDYRSINSDTIFGFFKGLNVVHHLL